MHGTAEEDLGDKKLIGKLERVIHLLYAPVGILDWNMFPVNLAGPGCQAL